MTLELGLAATAGLLVVAAAPDGPWWLLLPAAAVLGALAVFVWRRVRADRAATLRCVACRRRTEGLPWDGDGDDLLVPPPPHWRQGDRLLCCGAALCVDALQCDWRPVTPPVRISDVHRRLRAFGSDDVTASPTDP